MRWVGHVAHIEVKKIARFCWEKLKDRHLLKGVGVDDGMVK